MEEIREKIKQVERALLELKEYAISGDINAHESYSEIKYFDLESNLSDVIKSVKDSAIDELRRSFLDPDKKSYKGKNFIYTIRSGSTRYYFNEVPEVKEAESKMKSSDSYKKFKATESKYKTAFLLKQKNQTIVDEETGELVDPSLVKVVYSADSLSIKPVN